MESRSRCTNRYIKFKLGQYEAMTGGVANGTIVSALAYQPGYTYTVPYSNAVSNYPTSAMGIKYIKYRNQQSLIRQSS
jgi:hypothetical protein